MRLLRLGENALFTLPAEDLVARIARSVDLLDRVERELAVARWLLDSGFPATRVAEHVRQPLVLDGRPITFWRFVREDERQSASTEMLGRILRAFHDLPAPPFELPVFDPFSVVPRRLAEARGIDPEDLAFLDAMYRELRSSYAELRYALPEGLIHGDAHRGNLIMSGGLALLSDFEVVAFGPREWDLAVTALAADRFQLPDREYRAFVKSYGFDVKDWAGYPVLRSVRELTMTTWLMQNVSDDPAIEAEFRKRVSSLSKGDGQATWRAF